MHVVLGGGGGGKRRGKHGEYTGSGWQEWAGKRNDFLETKEREKGTGEPARASVVDLCVTSCSLHIVATSSPSPPFIPHETESSGKLEKKAETDPRSQRKALGVLTVRPFSPSTQTPPKRVEYGETESRSSGAQFGMEGEALMPNKTALARCWGGVGREVCYFPNECDQAIQDGDWVVPSSSYPLFIKTRMDTLTRVPHRRPRGLLQGPELDLKGTIHQAQRKD